MAHVIFVGNCQAAALETNFRLAYRGTDAHTFSSILTFGKTSPDQERLIRSADVAVLQKTDFPSALVDRIARTVPRHFFFPACVLFALWPFAVEPHVRNAPIPGLPAGPYPKQRGDRWLNARLKQGQGPEAIARAYLALDINKAVNLDRLLQLNAYKMSKLDEACGTQVWPLVEKHLRKRLVFHAPLHPANVIMDHITEVLLGRIGLDGPKPRNWRRRQEIWRGAPTPIHPSVIEALGLEWARGIRWRYANEGYFTYEESVARYVAYAHDPNLIRATALFRRREDPDALAAALQGVLETSPRSPALLYMMAETALRRDRIEEAERLLQGSIAIDPEDAAAFHLLGKVQARLGRPDEALASFDRAMALNPLHHPTLAWVTRLELDRGNGSRARFCAQQALLLKDDDANLWADLAKACEGEGRTAEAIRALKRAVALAPEAKTFGRRLAALRKRTMGHTQPAEPLAAAS